MRNHHGEQLVSLVEYNAMRPGIIQTFSALLGESVTEGHPARGHFTERYAKVRENMAALRDFLTLLGEES